MAVSKSKARQLAITAVEIGAHVLQGKITVGPEGAKINDINLSEWLADYADMDLMLIATPIEETTYAAMVKSCYTCGRDYKEATCPHCAEVRARLRGGQ